MKGRDSSYYETEFLRYRREHNGKILKNNFTNIGIMLKSGKNIVDFLYSQGIELLQKLRAEILVKKWMMYIKRSGSKPKWRNIYNSVIDMMKMRIRDMNISKCN